MHPSQRFCAARRDGEVGLHLREAGTTPPLAPPGTFALPSPHLEVRNRAFGGAQARSASPGECEGYRTCEPVQHAQAVSAVCEGCVRKIQFISRRGIRPGAGQARARLGDPCGGARCGRRRPASKSDLTHSHELPGRLTWAETRHRRGQQHCQAATPLTRCWQPSLAVLVLVRQSEADGLPLHPRAHALRAAPAPAGAARGTPADSKRRMVRRGIRGPHDARPLSPPSLPSCDAHVRAAGLAALTTAA